MYATPRLLNRSASACFAAGFDCDALESRPRISNGATNKHATAAPSPSVVNREVFNALLSLERLRGGLPGAFFHRDALIGANIFQLVRLPARPAHFKRIGLRRRAEAKG